MNDARYQETRNHVEDVDADEAPRGWADFEVVKDDRQHRDCTEPVYVRAIRRFGSYAAGRAVLIGRLRFPDHC